MAAFSSTTNLTEIAVYDEPITYVNELGDESQEYTRHSETEGSSVDKLDDASRLRMLGYDAVLGRPLGFWGSTAMNLCQLSCVYEYVSNSVIYGYQGGLLFVSRGECLR